MVPYNASKAGVEHFANALRLEVAHLGVDVGSAHMSVDRHSDGPRRPRATCRRLREMIERLPGPLSKTTSVDKCAAAFVKGIEARKSHINVPSWVGLFRWLKPLLSTPVVESQIVKQAADLIPKMDAEVAALGRSMSARTEALEKRPS